MRKIEITNSSLSAVIAHLEHGDALIVADAELPIPDSAKRIDLALKPGTPGLLETLEVVPQKILVDKTFVSCHP